MQLTAVLTLALSALAAASPVAHDRNSTRSSVSIGMNTAPIGEPSHYKSKNVKLYKLTSLNNIEARELIVQPKNNSSVNIDNVECRAYRDAAGLQPGSAPFSQGKPAELSTNLVTVGSVLCYVVESP